VKNIYREERAAKIWLESGYKMLFILSSLPIK